MKAEISLDEKIEQMKRDGKAFYLCEGTIQKIKDLSLKSDSVAGINWLIEHYQMVVEEVLKLQEENKSLRLELETEYKTINEFSAESSKLEKENEELKSKNRELRTTNTDLKCELFMVATKSTTGGPENISKPDELEKENSTLKNDLIKWETKYRGLETHHNIKFTEIRKENDELKSELDKTYKSINALSFEKTKTENNYNELLEHNAVLSAENKELKEFNTNSEKENEELKLKNMTAEKQLIDMSENYSESCIKNEELKETLRSIQAMDKEEPCARTEKLMEDVHRLTTEKRKLEDLNNCLSEENKKLKIEKENLLLDIETKTRESGYLEGKVDAYENVLDALKQE